MTNIELALTNLGEETAIELHKKNDSKELINLKKDMNDAGKVLSVAKSEIESKLERPVVSSENYVELTNSNELIEIE